MLFRDLLRDLRLRVAATSQKSGIFAARRGHARLRHRGQHHDLQLDQLHAARSDSRSSAHREHDHDHAR